MFNLQKLRTLHVRLSLSTVYAMTIVLIACWLSCALWSFDQQDTSLIYMSSCALYCSNMCGIWGAHSAALLFFLCGSAAYLIVFFLLFVAYRFFMQIKGRSDIDAYLSFIVALAASSGLSTFFGVDPMNMQVPGGVLGYMVEQGLKLFLDDFLSALLLIVLLSASFILITRISFVILGIYCMKASIYIGNGIWYSIPFITLSVQYIKRNMIALYRLFDGSQVHNEKYSVVDFELGINQEALDAASEEFWNKRFAKQPEHSTHQETAVTLIKPEIQKSENVVQEVVKNRPYSMPSPSLFLSVESHTERNAEQVKTNQSLAKVLEEKLERFGIHGSVISIKVGPVITLFEYQPHIDSKISKIIALEDDLALALQAVSIRIIAPIPGKSVVGFEVANKHRRGVLLGKALQSAEFQQSSYYLPLVLGEDSIGSTVIVDLASMPHLLVAGSTGSGKSVALNAMLISLLCRYSPQHLKLILVDPKRLEFAAYADIPHLLVPIVTDPRKAAPVLRWVVSEMEQRYMHMEECKVRNIFDYHLLCQQNNLLKAMPFMVIVIDELSDLMMTAAKETEDLIARIAQMARAAGIHMIVATQRPSVDVITGLIKVNFPSRISFRVTSKIDSRTILDCAGADKLLGKGDMLFLDSASRLQRAHGAFVSDAERAKCVAYITSQQAPEYIDIMQDFNNLSTDVFEEDDALYQDIIHFINTVDEVSISLLQRKFRIGYNRSARIIDRLQSEGIIMQEPGGKTRKVIK